MKIIYNGVNPLNYRSAPSGTVYMFDPSVAQSVNIKDEKFFKNMAKAPNSVFECVGIMGTKKKTTDGDEK